MKQGKVYLVGAGPGDPGLLTVKGLRLLGSADVVVYDHLVNPSLLELAPESAERVYAGKEPGIHAIDQEEINKLLAERARGGQTVVRLKGGDPFIFGRGGEEAEYLADQGIPFEVVPGVTAAVAVPAYAGIPLTHRDLSSSVVFLTGHKETPTKKSTIRWDRLAQSGDTLVFLMGVTNLPAVADQLIRHGRRPDEPVAVIQWGTTPEQRIVTGTLATIAEDAKREALGPPGIVVVGRVVELRSQMAWYEQLPLFGYRVVVTRPREQANRLGQPLEAAGAEVLYLPTITIAPPESWERLDRAIWELSAFDWVVFTSGNGVEQFFNRLAEQRGDVRRLGGSRIAAVGPETADSLRRRGIEPDLIPGSFRAEGLVASFQGLVRPGMKILLPAAAESRELLTRELTGWGAEVVYAPAYRTVPAAGAGESLRRELEAHRLHIVTFTSSSSVKSFMRLLGERGEQLMKDVLVASIGPVTAETVAEFGLETHIMPRQSTVPALAEAIIAYVSNSKSLKPPSR